MNEGWTGLPVYRDTPYNQNDPDWTKAYSNANKYFVDLSKWLNEISGGDKYTKGIIDFNPAQLEYLITSTLGGVATFPNEVVKFAETAAGAREFEWRNVPLANRLVKAGDERTANRKLTNQYFRFKEEAQVIGKRYRNYQKESEGGALEYAEKVNFMENSPEFARYLLFEAYEPEISGLWKASAMATDSAEKKQYEEQRFALMRKLVESMADPDAALRELENGE